MTIFAEAMRVAGMENSTLHTITSVFSFMKVCEDEIAKGKKKYPDRAVQINNMFLMLMPSKSMFELDLHLYRHHCTELIDRMGRQVNKAEMELATDAEVIIALMNTSMKTPLIDDATYAEQRLFKKIWGEDIPDFPGLYGYDYQEHESYRGAIDEIIYGAKKTLRKERK